MRGWVKWALNYFLSRWPTSELGESMAEQVSAAKAESALAAAGQEKADLAAQLDFTTAQMGAIEERVRLGTPDTGDQEDYAGYSEDKEEIEAKLAELGRSIPKLRETVAFARRRERLEAFDASVKAMTERVAAYDSGVKSLHELLRPVVSHVAWLAQQKAAIDRERAQLQWESSQLGERVAIPAPTDEHPVTVVRLAALRMWNSRYDGDDGAA